MSHFLIDFINISAPGKIILCGEHAVVYGKRALSSSINLRTNAALKRVPKSNLFRLVLNNLNNKTIEINENDFNAMKSGAANTQSNDIDQFLQQLMQDHKESGKCDDHLNAIAILLFSLPNLKWQNICDYELKVTTELPIGAGLGSSASFSACLVTAFLLLANELKFESENSLNLNDSHLSLINKHTFSVEKWFHGKPSGIDNTVITYGNYIIFQNGQIIDKFKSNLDLQILVIDSKIEKKTREQVAKVRQLHETYPKLIDNVMNSIDDCVDNFIKVIRTTNENKVDQMNLLNELITINQGLLYSLKISNYTLNTITSIAQKHNYACKITGAGGGGCLYALIADNNDNQQNYENFLRELDALNVSYFKCKLACDGVKLDNLKNIEKK